MKRGVGDDHRGQRQPSADRAKVRISVGGWMCRQGETETGKSVNQEGQGFGGGVAEEGCGQGRCEGGTGVGGQLLCNDQQ